MSLSLIILVTLNPHVHGREVNILQDKGNQVPLIHLFWLSGFLFPSQEVNCNQIT